MDQQTNRLMSDVYVKVPFPFTGRLELRSSANQPARIIVSNCIDPPIKSTSGPKPINIEIEVGSMVSRPDLVPLLNEIVTVTPTPDNTDYLVEREP